MAVRYLSYKDIPAGRRSRAGKQAMTDLRRALAMPGLSDGQRQEVQAGIDRLAAWVEGSMEAPAPDVPHCERRAAEPPPPPPGQHFEVVVTEGLSVDDGLG